MNIKTRVLVIGGVLGAAFGVLGAWLYLKANPVEVGAEGEEQIVLPSAGHALKWSLGALGLLRQIVD